MRSSFADTFRDGKKIVVFVDDLKIEGAVTDFSIKQNSYAGLFEFGVVMEKYNVSKDTTTVSLDEKEYDLE